MPLTSLRELTLPTQKALTSRDQKTFLARSNYSSEVGPPPGRPVRPQNRSNRMLRVVTQ